MMEWKNYPLNEKFDDFESYDSNPFFKLIEEGGYITRQQGSTFKASSSNLVDNNTGEISTVYVRDEKKKYLDKREFVKMPITGFPSIANLVPSELKLLIFIFTNLKQSVLEINIKVKDVMIFSGYASRNPVYKALTGLLNKGFIAKKDNAKYTYFINPFIFYKGSIISEFFGYAFEKNKTIQSEIIQEKIEEEEKREDDDELS